MALDPLLEKYFDLCRETMPDSRLSRTERTEWHPVLGEVEPVFCANCGKRYGACSKGAFEHVLALCNECFAEHGHLPCPQVPEPLLKGVYVP